MSLTTYDLEKPFGNVTRKIPDVIGKSSIHEPFFVAMPEGK